LRRVSLVTDGPERQQQAVNQYVDDARRRQPRERSHHRAGDRETHVTGFYTHKIVNNSIRNW
jgi:hypothetical protein